MCGFRGFRDKVRIEFGSGFTVISGRNGVGKSTICDAVEYALRGSIDKYRFEKSGSESLADYVWWRGRGRPDAHYVSLALFGKEGERIEVTRSRESGSDRSASELEDVLCTLPRPEDALALLCRTSIIRDEWISALSVDMKETDRFRMVSSALGTAEGTHLAERGRAVVAQAERRVREAIEEYERLRTDLADSTTDMSAAQATFAQAGDLQAARDVLAREATEKPEGIHEQLALARRQIVGGRSRLSTLAEAIRLGEEFVGSRDSLLSTDFREQYDLAQVKLVEASEKKSEAERDLEQAERELSVKREADEIAASLLQLSEHGARIGLHDSQCPLCGSDVTTNQFEAGLANVRKRAQELASGVTKAAEAWRVAQERAAFEKGEYLNAHETWAELENQWERLAEKETALVEFLGTNGLDPEFVGDLGGLRTQLEAERDVLIDLERALITLESSQFAGRIARLERRLSMLRDRMEEVTAELRRWEGALADAKAMERVVRRVNAEFVEERLAKISPLLNELYERLRPHADWRTIDYHIRGDVRRFLSLRVGDGLDPQFVLSSGQRRAVGLAFLLSIHVTRAWTKWRTLLLDDPVQHIDDFRSLHFVEVLSALRLDDRQIVCTVEDEALADLLCRRLSNTPQEEGRRYEIGVDAEGITGIVRDERVAPLPTGTLRFIQGA